MGFAIQRGATCTVAAMSEIVESRRATRLVALLAAAMWVASLVWITSALGLHTASIHGYPVSVWTLVGGVMLGVGAWVTGGCVFGAIARLGSGEWAFAFTPVGFLIGALALTTFFEPAASASVSSPLQSAPTVALMAATLFVATEVVQAVRAAHAIRQWKEMWSPRLATTVIGVTFFILLLNEGPWAYTDALADTALARPGPIASRLGLFFALLVGASLGGWAVGRLHWVAPDAGAIARCTLGGAMMGAGSLLIPGSNDGLILLGMPLWLPYAWVGFAVMCASVVLCLLATRTLRP
jgi:toxin CptA